MSAKRVKIRRCIVCNRQGNSSEELTSFHKFPSDETTRQAWKQFCVELNCLLPSDSTENVRVCSDHFPPTAYKSISPGKPLRLKKGSTPMIQGYNREYSDSEDNTQESSIQQCYIPAWQDNNYTPQSEEEVLGTLEGDSQSSQSNIIMLDVKQEVDNYDATYQIESLKFENRSPENSESANTSGCDMEQTQVPESEVRNFGIDPLFISFTTQGQEISQECDHSDNLQQDNEYKKRKVYPGDFSNEDMESPEEAKRFRTIALGTLEAQSKKIKYLQQHERRMVKRISSLQSTINVLKNKNSGSSDVG